MRITIEGRFVFFGIDQKKSNLLEWVVPDIVYLEDYAEDKWTVEDEISPDGAKSFTLASKKINWPDNDTPDMDWMPTPTEISSKMTPRMANIATGCF